jgi:hypothetical protein
MDLAKYIVTCLVLTDKAFSSGIFFCANCLHCLQKKIKLGGVCLLTVKETISGDEVLYILGILYMSVALHWHWPILRFLQFYLFITPNWPLGSSDFDFFSHFEV